MVAERANLDGRELRQLAGKVLDVHAGAPVDVGWIFTGQQEDLHAEPPAARSSDERSSGCGGDEGPRRPSHRVSLDAVGFGRASGAVEMKPVGAVRCQREHVRPVSDGREARPPEELNRCGAAELREVQLHRLRRGCEVVTRRTVSPRYSRTCARTRVFDGARTAAAAAILGSCRGSRSGHTRSGRTSSRGRSCPTRQLGRGAARPRDLVARQDPGPPDGHRDVHDAASRDGARGGPRHAHGCSWASADRATGERVVDGLRRAVNPDIEAIIPMSWTAWQSAADDSSPRAHGRTGRTRRSTGSTTRQSRSSCAAAASRRGTVRASTSTSWRARSGAFRRTPRHSRAARRATG